MSAEEALKQEISKLQGQLKGLTQVVIDTMAERDEMAFLANLPKDEALPFYDMSRSQRRILRVLQAREWVSHETLFEAVYQDRPLSDWPENPGATISVMICKIRKTLEAEGIPAQIISVMGEGYRMEKLEPAADLVAKEKKAVIDGR